MLKVIEFPADRIEKGIHTHYPEMGERKVYSQIEARLSHSGSHYFLYTKLELKGRGIMKSETGRLGVNCYKVTWAEFDKLKQEYSISMERYLD